MRPAPTLTKDEQARFVAWVLGYAILIVALLGTLTVFVVTDTSALLCWPTTGLLISTTALAVRHLSRAIGPLPALATLRASRR